MTNPVPATWRQVDHVPVTAQSGPAHLTGRVASWAGIGVVALVAVAISLRAANWHTPVDTWWVGNIGLTIGLGTMGVLLTRAVPRNPIGWIFLVGAVGQGLTAAGREWAVFAVVTRPGALPAPGLAGWLSVWTSTIAIGTLPLVLLHFPTGRLPSRRWRPVRTVIVVLIGLAALSQALVPGVFTSDMPTLANPMGAPWMGQGVATAFWVAMMVMMVPAAASLVLRWRGGTPLVRSQLKWVAAAAVLLTVEVIFESSPLGRLPGVPYATSMCLALFIASIALSILRHHLWDLDVIVNVSIVYAILTALVGAVFVVVVALAGRFIDGESTLWPALVALGVFGVLVAPLRTRVQAGVDRVLYGGRRDPHQVLTLLAGQLDNPAEPDTVLREAARAVASASLRLDYVAITRLRGGTTVSVGTARTGIESLALTHQGVEVGRLHVAHRPGSRMGHAARRQLGELAERLGAVVHAVDVSEAVRRSRQALAAAREEERRRVRRDLHDGLGPAMAAVALKVDAARMMLDNDPARAREVLVQLGSDIRETITDVRRLVYDLQPPVLDSAGLLVALADRVAAFGNGDADALRVTLEAPDDLGDLSAAVELAAYRIVCEALTNVTRHAEATRCRVIVERDPGRLRITVDDDGRGLVEPVQVGIGTASMMERASALGGWCRLERAPLGGARVEVSLPMVGAAQEDRDIRPANQPPREHSPVQPSRIGALS